MIRIGIPVKSVAAFPGVPEFCGVSIVFMVIVGKSQGGGMAGAVFKAGVFRRVPGVEIGVVGGKGEVFMERAGEFDFHALDRCPGSVGVGVAIC